VGESGGAVAESHRAKRVGKFAFSFTKIVNFPPKVNSGQREKTPTGSVFISVRHEERRDASSTFV
jgi:hypothetical protein